MTPATSPVSWLPDTVLPGFEAHTFTFPPDYDGPVTATLVRRLADLPAKRAVLYIHGFVDYFFQVHMAAAYNAHGFNFYALDLRKSGRSMLPNQRYYFCYDMHEYFPEMDMAISLIRASEGKVPLLLNGHSTGGLLSTFYAAEGAYRDQIDAIFLNSPFFGLNVPPLIKTISPIIATFATWFPNQTIGKLTPMYGESLHRAYRGEWDFDERMKPVLGMQARLGWVRAVYHAQRRIQAGLRIPQPILLMHSARSGGGDEWNASFTNSDCVLNVEDMRRYGPGLGPKVKMVSIDDGLHDLVLSAAPVRERVFHELFAWTETYL